jgi:Flp pilus assembly protein TadD
VAAQDPPPADSEPPTVVIQEGISAAEGSAAQSRHDSAEGIRAKVLHLWFARKAALETSDTVTAEARVEELRAYMQQEGITADRMIARGFAYEGYENLREGNYERAREAFDLARAFDPYLPQAQFGYAWSLLRAGRGIYPFITEYRRGLGLSWARFTTDEVQITNFTVVAAFGILAGMVAFSLVVIARCQARLRHDLFEAARRRMPEGGARLAAWTIFLLPLLLWAGGFWLILYWLALCFRYMRLPEKTVAAGIFLMTGLSPLGVMAVIDRVQASTDPEIRVVVSAMQAGYNPETLRQLKQVVAAHDDQPELHLLLGTAYAKGDLLGEAFDEYQRVLDGNPASTSALVDVGNVYYRLGEWAQAANHYKKAAQIQPDQTSAYWNLYLAQTELLHFAEADASLAKAREIDHTLTGRLLARKKGEQIGDLLLEEPASLNRIKVSLRQGDESSSQRLRTLGNALSLASGAGLILALLLSAGGSTRQAETCTRCARPHCARCRVDQGASGLCARCVHLFVKKEGLTAEARTEGRARLERRERLGSATRRIISFVLPGAGQILAGRLALGFSLMMGWVITIIFLAARDRLLQPPRVPVTDLAPPGVVLSCCVMVILWIVGNSTSTRRRAATGDVNGS